MPLSIDANVPLAPRTTLELGGRARWLAHATSEAEVVEALDWAAGKAVPVAVLAGGSNTIIPDDGFPGLVLVPALRGLSFEDDRAGAVRVTVGAGEPWDALVQETVARDLAGLECLSGIPGSAGATPIQNVGAYGQEVSETVREVRVLRVRDRATETRTPTQCGFAYRDSAFKRDPGKVIVLSVTFALRRGGPPALRYGELIHALGEPPGSRGPRLAEVRAAVLALRRRKSMVFDPADPNHRSAGSFFTNPAVDTQTADAVAAQAVAEGLVASADEVPRYPTEDGRVKLAAGWLIERAGLAKGTRRGPVGLSTQHALALVHHGGGRTEDLLAFADEVRDAVRARFGVSLEREPRLLEALPNG